jgi:hypothetical protein
MFETPIHSSFVAQVAPVGFADAADVVEDLSGQTVGTGRARLEIGERIGNGLAGAVWYHGVLRTGAPLMPPVKVDIVVSPWAAGRTEIGIRPLGRLGRLDSLRANRFFDAAWSVMPELVDRLAVAAPVPVPVQTGERVAA